MKLSVSLPDDDLALLDEFVRSRGLPSRSAGLQRAIRMLRFPDLEQDYRAAWEEWEASGDEQAWAGASADGLTDATR
jgi:Arc/MetJ-type ribon-helix-helix transcriptional regulator